MRVQVAGQHGKIRFELLGPRHAWRKGQGRQTVVELQHHKLCRGVSTRGNAGHMRPMTPLVQKGVTLAEAGQLVGWSGG